MKFDLSLGSRVSGFDDEGHFRPGEPRHFKFEMRVALSAGLGSISRRLGGAFDARGHFGAGDGFSILTANGDLQSSAFAGEPTPGVRQFQGKSGFRSGSGLSWCRRRRLCRSGRGWGWLGRRWCGWMRKKQRTGANIIDRRAMLLIQTQLQSFLGVWSEWQQIEIIISAAMQHAAAAINGGVDQSAGGSAIFRLHVIGIFTHADVGIVPEEHALIRLCTGAPSTSQERTLQKVFRRI